MTRGSLKAKGRRVYPTSQIKRPRATRAEVDDRRQRLADLVTELAPATVRQVFYAATVRGFIEKTEQGYDKVQTDLTLLRRAGIVPYGSLVDNTRMQRKPRTFSSLQAAVDETAAFYRRSVWSELDTYVEVWLEKDALSGTLLPVTATYDVGLMVARGYASLSFLHSAAEYMAELEKRIVIFHLGDHDPSGVNAAHKIESTLREMAPNADITFERLAVLPEQITAWNLPSRPTKQSDSRAKNFMGDSVELDAIPPGTLRQLVQDRLDAILPEGYLATLEAAEESEREILTIFAENYRQGHWSR
jgi:hypothetical protein